MFVISAYCNGCHKPAPNANKIPAGWIEFKSTLGGTYHYCKVCVIVRVASEAQVPLDTYQDAKSGGETIFLTEVRPKRVYSEL